MAKGIRLIVDTNGTFVTSKTAQTEEEDIIYEGMFHEETMQFEAIKIDDDDSENELHGDELEASMDTFLLEHFADEN